MDNLDYHNDKMAIYKYGVSKAGNYLHATEFAKRYREDGIVSVPLNPGNLSSELYRSQGSLVSVFFGVACVASAGFGGVYRGVCGVGASGD